MSAFKCNFQMKAGPREKATVLNSSHCDGCNISLSDLVKKGQALEMCAAEHYSDPVSGERYLITIALCPDCHRDNHLDAKLEHQPCQFTAQRSWQEI